MWGAGPWGHWGLDPLSRAVLSGAKGHPGCRAEDRLHCKWVRGAGQRDHFGQRVVKVMGPGVQILCPPLAHLDRQLGLPEPGFTPMCRGMSGKLKAKRRHDGG